MYFSLEKYNLRKFISFVLDTFDISFPILISKNYYFDFSIFFIFKVTAILGGIIFYQLASKENGVCTFTQERIKNVSTAAFYAVTVMALFNVLTAALKFPLEIPIFFHEVIF